MDPFLDESVTMACFRCNYLINSFFQQYYFFSSGKATKKTWQLRWIRCFSGAAAWLSEYDSCKKFMPLPLKFHNYNYFSSILDFLFFGNSYQKMLMKAIASVCHTWLNYSIPNRTRNIRTNKTHQNAAASCKISKNAQEIFEEEINEFISFFLVHIYFSTIE